MLYILRLTNGDSIVLLAPDEQAARRSASQLDRLRGENIVSVRPLDSFEIKLSPTEDGGLEITSWNDAALDSILANEYPALFDSYQRANAHPFARSGSEPPLQHLEAEFERNAEIIRQALAQEIQRFAGGGTEVSAPATGIRGPIHSQSSAASRSK